MALQSAEFGPMLKQYRQAAALTQEELADRAGLSVRGISNLERGVRLTPRDFTVQRLADALEIAPSDREHFILVARHGRRISRNDATVHGVREPMLTLIGRKAELEIVEQHLTGLGPPFLALAGEPGIGKSRILQETAVRAAAHGLTIIQGGASRRSGQEPFAPFPEILACFLAQQSPESARKLLDGCGWLVRLLPELLETISAPPLFGSLPPEQERRLVFAAVERFLEAVAGAAGTLLVLDDFQWSGPGAYDLLASIVRRARHHAIRVVGAYRDTEVQSDHPFAGVLAELGEQELVQQLTLPPLDVEDATALLDELLPEGEDTVTRDAIVRQAGGVPFFLVSCAHAAGRHGWRLPWNLAHSIQQRVSMLSPDARGVLEMAAVLGRTVPRTALLSMGKASGDEVLLGLDEACRARLLLREGKREYRFAHDVVREVIENGLSPERKMILYRKSGNALENLPDQMRRHRATQIAWYYTQGDDARRALPWTLCAGDQATAAFANDEAERHYRIAAEQAKQVGDLRREVEALLKLGRALRVAGFYHQALEPLEKAAEICLALNDPDGEAEVVTEIGHTQLERGTPIEGLNRVLPALKLLETRATPEKLGWLYLSLTGLLLVTGRLTELWQEAERWLELARQLGHKEILANATRTYATVLMTSGRVDEAEYYFREAVVAAEASGNVGAHFEALSAPTVLLHAGMVDQSLRHARRALALCEQTESPGLIARRLRALAEVLIVTGEWPEARNHLDRALRLTRPGESIYAIPPLRVLGFLCICVGELDEASKYLLASLSLAEQSQEPVTMRAALGCLALLDMQQGYPDQALARVQPLLEGLTARFEEHELARFIPIAAEAQLAMGRVTRARNLAERIVSRNRARRQHLALVHALRVQGMVAARQGRTRDATTAFDEAVSMTRRMGYTHAEAQLLHEYGMMYSNCRNAERARDQLNAAQTIFQQLGAKMDVHRTEQALATLGPTRSVISEILTS